MFIPPVIMAPHALLCEASRAYARSFEYKTSVLDDFEVDMDTAALIVQPSRFYSFCPWPIADSNVLLQPLMVAHVPEAVVVALVALFFAMLVSKIR